MTAPTLDFLFLFVLCPLPLIGIGYACLSAPLIGDFIEAGIDIGGCINLSLGAWHDEPHQGNFGVLGILTAHADECQGEQPARGHRLASIYGRQDAAGKAGGKGATGVADRHHVGYGLVGQRPVAAGDGVRCDVELYEARQQSGAVAVLQFVANAFSYNLHIDTGTLEIDVLVLGNIGRTVILVESGFGYDVDVAGHVQDSLSGIVVRHFCAVGQESADLPLFALPAVGIGLIVIACRKQERGGKEEEESAKYITCAK